MRTGLKPNETVIVGGGQKVKPGQTVAPTRVAFKLPTAALAQVEAKPVQTAQLAVSTN